MKPVHDRPQIVSGRIYGLLLFAYPKNFRREYGPHMTQVFRDCYRADPRRTRACRLWLNTLVDLLRTAPKERMQNVGQGVVMKAIRNLAIAIVIYAVAIFVAGRFLANARHYLPFALGTFIDALVSIGVLFNFIVLLLVSTRLMAAPRAVVTSAIATLVVYAGTVSIIAMIEPAARPAGISIIMMALSFAIWFVVHWFWAQRKTQQPAM
ncbi:MAG TPA: hypothetical protein VJM12_05850, partial [Pyrinomonadaceae bacterium]|nr:hypothetical protein [Pyrinomonadaceae bacterium]